jgi:alpha-L-fucosidase 2
MKIKTCLVIILTGLLISSCTSKKDQPYNDNSRLWFEYPARYWNSQALHLGNSYFGASYFGGVGEEVIALTDQSMWTGGPAMGEWEKAGVNPKALKALPEIRRAVIHGESQVADSLITRDFFGSGELQGNFTSIGELKLKFAGQDEGWEHYTRSLDLTNSIGHVQYDLNNIKFSREYFCSYPDRVLAMKFSADSPGMISFDISMDIIQDSSSVEIKGNTYRVKGFISGNNRPFEVLIQVNNDGGVLDSKEENLTIREANSVELYLATATNYEMRYPDYTGDDPENITNDIMDKVLTNNYKQLKQRHISDYRSLYDRVRLQLDGHMEAEQLPTNERFQRLCSGEPDPGYKVLAFNLGRYMIISSSRPNSLPANLQGVWNAFRVAPWTGNYQSNINLQEIYWSCGPTDLAECQQSYIDWIDNLAISGREISRRVYGTNGWVSHTTGNIWGHAAPIGNHPWGMYPMGAAWHCQHVWDQYAFTRDMQYLEEQAYPLLRDASVFWLENLIPYQGYLIAAPSVSAEHGALMTEEGLNPAFHDFRSKDYHYSLPGLYQDAEMIWDLFTNTANAARLLGEDDFADSLQAVREKLLPPKIGKHGQLQEWFEDIDHPDCKHRHIAHLYGVCPGSQIHPTTAPELANAAKKSLDMRGDGRYPEQELASGGNWSRAHRMWCWARLMDGNRSNKILTEILTEQGFENVLTYQHSEYHWERKDFYLDRDLYCHFQLDASASIPGCMAEMLLQSHMGEIHLLPALPDEFRTGKITGLRARGGYSVDMEWKDHELLSADIYNVSNEMLPVIRLKDNIIKIEDYEDVILIH